MINFLTLEDVNTVKFSNQDFWWHSIDCSQLPSGDFSNLKVDFCHITKQIENNYIVYTVKVDNDYWTKGAIGVYNGVNRTQAISIIDDNTFRVYENTSYSYSHFDIVLYMGLLNVDEELMGGFLRDTELSLNLKELESTQSIKYSYWVTPAIIGTMNVDLNVGYNEIQSLGYCLVNLVKTDFQFQCAQQLTLGKVNTVRLGALSDYKPNGDLVGGYTPRINVFFENSDTLIPVTFDSTLNDYVFNIDLTDKQNEGKIRFYVNIDANEVINDSLTEVTLDCKFETINTFSKLQTLFRNGGVGRLGANITVTDDLTVTKSVYLIGNDRTLNMNAHKIVVPSDMTFKAENTQFTNGKNTIQQNTGSNVELTNCTFTNCTGLGSVIDCQVTIGSLSENDDFTTTLTGCTITNSDTAILHGGDLTVTKCTINGKIGLKEYPYFLYQTDGTAALTSNQFSLTHNGIIDYDIEFNPCIFVCGENALVNGLNHSEWSKNNIMDFLGLQKNRSSIDVTYYYNLIEDYVHLNSSEGYCHTVSDTDYVFKTNITINRGE